MPSPSDSIDPANGVSRRSFMQTLGASAAAASITSSAQALEQRPSLKREPGVEGPGPIDIVLDVNGQPRRLRVEPSTTLLEALRLQIGLTGTKEICDRGSCGGCCVILDGKLVNACMMFAADAAGAKLTTVEGLASGGALQPVQEAFIRHDALQCGYCTPGFLVASAWLLKETPKPSLDQIKKALSGNICRCGTYTNVFNAVLEASGQPVLIDPILS